MGPDTVSQPGGQRERDNAARYEGATISTVDQIRNDMEVAAEKQRYDNMVASSGVTVTKLLRSNGVASLEVTHQPSASFSIPRFPVGTISH